MHETENDGRARLGFDLRRRIARDTWFRDFPERGIVCGRVRDRRCARICCGMLFDLAPITIAQLNWAIRLFLFIFEKILNLNHRPVKLGDK
jgi:hypothetical protein